MQEALNYQEEEEEDPEKKTNKNMKLVSALTEERWAFLERDALDQEVVVTEVFTPGHFYVRRLKFNPQLTALERDLGKAAAAANDAAGIEVGVGEVCGAEVQKGCFLRVKVLEESPGSSIQALCLDYGTVEKDLDPAKV